MVATKLQAVRARIADAARRAGRPPESVRLICVTKSATVDQVRAAIAAGAADFGENRVQDAAPKIDAVGRSGTWHMIGHLQRNKAKAALERFAWIHSVDTVALALMLERQAAASGRTVPILIEVNVAGEATKHGVPPEAVDPLLAVIGTLPHLQAKGLMTMAPLIPGPGHRRVPGTGEESRPHFRTLRQLAERFKLSELSMGMSQDFEVAVEEGATMVRVGTAIFG
ncbi:MAG: YggS family pyridoxal phosphate-dependent enzyme [Candidatus Omnitrophica bacterium]|nr:YggS family pyridoxal phosphate-dependent enzyme [Candidatus Omnitrophota bacterium]